MMDEVRSHRKKIILIKLIKKAPPELVKLTESLFFYIRKIYFKPPTHTIMARHAKGGKMARQAIRGNQDFLLGQLNSSFYYIKAGVHL